MGTLLAVAIGLYAALLTLLALSSRKIDPFLGSTVFGIASTITPLSIWLMARQSGKTMLPATPTGLAWSVAAGTVAGLFTALLVRIFEKGAVSFASPVIYGGTLALSTLIGWLLLKEEVSGTQAAGIALTAVGIGLIAWSKLRLAA